MFIRILRPSLLLISVIIVTAAIFTASSAGTSGIPAFTTPADKSGAAAVIVPETEPSTVTASTGTISTTEASSATAAAAPARIETEDGIKNSTKAATPAGTAAKSKASKAAAPVKTATAGKESLKQIFKNRGINPSKANIEIAVDKSDHTLGIIANGILLKTYHVELGNNGLGDKNISGDHKTPEGTFYISEKSVLKPADKYLGSRWMELSYPNMEDANRGLKQGLISQKIYNSIASAIREKEVPPQSTALGGGVGIHGGSTPALGSNWTWGCVGLANSDVEDFYDYVRIGTKVTIQK